MMSVQELGAALSKLPLEEFEDRSLVFGVWPGLDVFPMA